MVRGKKTKGMVMLLLFLGSAIVYAAPTMNDFDEGGLVFVEFSGPYVYPCRRPEKDNNTGLFKSHLASVSEEFHRLPVRYGKSTATTIEVKALPSVPGTLLMVLVGFLCVSLVKDRRIWLAALSGVLWTGQAGISLLPQLALNVSGRGLSASQSSSHYPACLCEIKHHNCLRNDIKDTCYVGLLRHLAGIPNTGTSSIPRIKVRHQLKKTSCRMPLSFCRRTFCSGKSVQSFRRPVTHKSSHFVKIEFSSYMRQAILCLILEIERYVHFTSVFINVSLARGPPDFNEIINILFRVRLT